jgi:dynein light intermediate chain 2
MFAILSKLSTTSLVLVVDLSAPEELIITTETLLSSIRELISTLLSKKSTNTMEKQLRERAIQRLGKVNEDIRQLNLFPIPLLIIGSKYDIFQANKSLIKIMQTFFFIKIY